jgi:hypothetical protein
MTIETLGIDLGKTTCSIVGLADTGTVVFGLPAMSGPSIMLVQSCRAQESDLSC